MMVNVQHAQIQKRQVDSAHRVLVSGESFGDGMLVVGKGIKKITVEQVSKLLDYSI